MGWGEDVDGAPAFPADKAPAFPAERVLLTAGQEVGYRTRRSCLEAPSPAPEPPPSQASLGHVHQAESTARATPQRTRKAQGPQGTVSG